MSLPTKVYNVSGDYIITCANGDGLFQVNAANILFNGNVTTVANSITSDDFITVAANNNGVITSMGILAQTNVDSFAGFRFDSVANQWQISSNVTSTGTAISSYLPIVSGNLQAAGSNTQLQFNNQGNFGATGNLTFDYTAKQLFLKGSQVLGNTATPANVANAVALYSNAVGSGGTGLYFTSSSAHDELVSKSKAIVYSIIF